MARYVYVDNSNVWIEGQRVSAVRKGLAIDIRDAMSRNVLDPSWRCDFGRLYELACPVTETIGRSALFGSRPPANDSLWARARSEGFEVVVHDRNVANREKKVDVGIATMLLDDSHEYMRPGQDTAVLVAGDGDYVPTVESLKRRGIRVECLFWGQANRELRECVDAFQLLDPHFGFLAGES
jgi:uncharacterized LabA/DUF88 family protein